MGYYKMEQKSKEDFQIINGIRYFSTGNSKLKKKSKFFNFNSELFLKATSVKWTLMEFWRLSTEKRI